MSPNTNFLDSVIAEKLGKPVKYLAELRDQGPEEPHLDGYVDADTLKEICNLCHHKRAKNARLCRRT